MSTAVERVDLTGLFIPWYRHIEAPLVFQLPGDALMYIPVWDRMDELDLGMQALEATAETYSVRRIYDHAGLLRVIRSAEKPEMRLVVNFELSDGHATGLVLDPFDPSHQ